MLQFEEYKVKLNNLKPQLEELYESLGLDRAKREVEELEIKSSQPGFWDNPEESQKIVSRMGALKGKIEAYNHLNSLCDDLLTICEMAIEENDESMLEELENGYKELEEGVAEQKLSTLLTGEYDHNNALVSFHAGAGGTEAQDWCEVLYRMYTRWAERHGFTYKIMVYQDGEEPQIILTEEKPVIGSDGGIHTLELRSNLDYDIQLPDQPDWLREITTRTLSTYTHRFEADPNESYDSRSTRIVFTNTESGISQTVTVTQMQRNAILVSKEQYMLDAAAGTLEFKGQYERRFQDHDLRGVDP